MYLFLCAFVNTVDLCLLLCLYDVVDTSGNCVPSQLITCFVAYIFVKVRDT